MKLQTIAAAGVAVLSLGVTAVTAQAKTWHYHVTTSNSFSTSSYHRAYLYGGRNDQFVSLYTTAKAANSQDSTHYHSNFSDFGRNKTYYAEKAKGYSRVYKLKYKSKAYYMNTKDAGVYRYNAWRSGSKIVSFAKPTNTSYVMLKAKNKFNKSQPWYYNYGGKANPIYNKYQLSSKGNWYIK